MKTRPPLTTENQSVMHQVVFLNLHTIGSSGRQAKKNRNNDVPNHQQSFEIVLIVYINVTAHSAMMEMILSHPLINFSISLGSGRKTSV